MDYKPAFDNYMFHNYTNLPYTPQLSQENNFLFQLNMNDNKENGYKPFQMTAREKERDD